MHGRDAHATLKEVLQARGIIGLSVARRCAKVSPCTFRGIENRGWRGENGEKKVKSDDFVFARAARKRSFSRNRVYERWGEMGWMRI